VIVATARAATPPPRPWHRPRSKPPSRRVTDALARGCGPARIA
jgi:hypothetical protein